MTQVAGTALFVAGALLHLAINAQADELARKIVRDMKPVQVTSESDNLLDYDVSRDGKWLAYSLEQDGTSDLWLRPADPSVVQIPRRLTRNPSRETGPVFSPDGLLLAFVGLSHDVKGDIFLIDLRAGGSISRVTGRDTSDGAPCFSPDGRTLYFHMSGPGEKSFSIAEIRLPPYGRKRPIRMPPADEIEPTIIRDNASYPSVSSKGDRIAFVSPADGATSRIMSLDLNTGQVDELTDGRWADMRPVWKPDGTGIFFSRILYDTNGDGERTSMDRSTICKTVSGHSFPVTPPTMSASRPRVREHVLFYLSDRGGIVNCWRAATDGAIPQAMGAAEQIAIADRVAAEPSSDVYDSLPCYYAVLADHWQHETECARAALTIGDTYQQMGLDLVAREIFSMIPRNWPGGQPEATLADIRLISINTARRLAEEPDSAIHRKIADDGIAGLARIASTADPRSALQARMEHAKLLAEVHGDPASLLKAISILDTAIKDAIDAGIDVARAKLLKADILGKTGRAEGVATSYLSVIKDHPDNAYVTSRAIERVLDLTIPSSDTLAENILALREFADRHREITPVLAMGALNRVGDLLYAADEWTEAKAAYRQVLDQFKITCAQRSAARLALAEILYREERFYQALDLYKDELNLRPPEDRISRLARTGYIRKSVASGEFLFRIGEVSSAQNTFAELIKYDASIVEAHRGYIKCSVAMGELDRVTKLYRLAMKEDPSNPVPVYATALCLTYYDDERSLRKASSLLDRALAANSRIEYFHQTRGYVWEVLETVHGQHGKLEKALDSYRKAYLLNDHAGNPENAANLLLNIGNVYYVLGRFSKALDHYALRRDSKMPFDNPDTELLFYRRLGECAFQHGSNNDAAEAYRTALQLVEKRNLDRFRQLEAELSDRLALALQEAGRYGPAIEHFERSFELNSDLGFKYNLSRIRRSIAHNRYMLAGTRTGASRDSLLRKAREEFEEVLELVDTDGVPRAGKNENKGALISATVSVSLDKVGGTQASDGFSKEQEVRLALTFIARIDMELGELADAREILDEQIKKYPDEATVNDKDQYGVALLLHRAGLLAAASGEPDAAIDYFRRSAVLNLEISSPVGAMMNVANIGRLLPEATSADAPATFRNLDDQMTRLLDENPPATGGTVIPEFQNAMGTYYLSIPVAEGAAGAVKRMNDTRRAATHFRLGLKALETAEGSGTPRREHIALACLLNLNMARLAAVLRDDVPARESFAAALKLATRGVLPQYRWRALAGLGRLEEAMDVLSKLTVKEAGCVAGEIMNAFEPLILRAVTGEDPEMAFDLTERLSEIERFNRTAHLINHVLVDSRSAGTAADFARASETIQRIRDIKARIAGAKGDDAIYLSESLQEEQLLLDRMLGDESSKLPEPVAGISDPDERETVLLLLGIAERIDRLAEEIAASEQPDDELQKKREGLVALYHATRTRARYARQPNTPARALALLGPEPAESIDIMDVLPPGTKAARIIDVEDGAIVLTVTPDEVSSRRYETVSSAAQKLASDRPTTYVIYEYPQRLPISGPIALNAAHLYRALSTRKPFKSRHVVLPPDLPERAHTLTVKGMARAAMPTVPTVEGARARSLPGVVLADGTRMRADLLFRDAPSLSLAIFTDTTLADAYIMGHLAAIYGCSTIVLPETAGQHDDFLDAFGRFYAKGSALSALRSARDSTNSVDWKLIGFAGMTSKEATEYALTRFSDYVSRGATAFKAALYDRALVDFENASYVASETPDLRSKLPRLYEYARESAYRSGQPAVASRYADMLVARLTDSDPYSEDHAEAMLSAGILHSQLEDFTNAIALIEEAVLTLSDLELEERHAEALTEFGTVLESSTEYDRALNVLRKAASESQELDLTELLARQYVNMGRIYDLRLSNYAPAMESYRKAMELYRTATPVDTNAVAMRMLDIGRCSRLLGDFAGAARNYDGALALVGESTNNASIVARITVEQANNAWFQARYEEAFKLQRRALSLARQHDLPLMRVICLNTSGLIWWTLGDYDRALSELSAAKKEAGKLGAREDEVASTLNNIGLVHRDTGRYEQALAAFEEALAIDRRLGSRWAIGYDLRNTALTYLEMGSASNSVPLFKEAIEVSGAIGNRINEAKALLGLGQAYLETGDRAGAEDAFTRALAMAEKMLMRETEWRSVHGLARLRLAEEDTHNAEQLLYRAVDIIDGMRAEIKIDQMKDSFADNKLDVYEDLVRLLADLGKSEEAFNVAERSRARSFIDLLGNQHLKLKNAVDQDFYDEVTGLRARMDEQHALVAQAKDEDERALRQASLSRLNTTYQNLMVEIQAKNPQLSSMVSVQPLTADEVSGLLGTNVAMLCYYILPDELLCWVLRGGREPRLVTTPVDREKLGRDILAYRRMVQNLEPLEKQSRELHSLLISPVEQLIEGVDQLGIVPHGPLHYLSFATLADDTSYVVDRYPLFYLPSGSVLKYTLERRPKDKNLNVLAIGNPDLGNPDLALPFAEHEVASIQWNFPKITTLTGQRATEEWVKKNIGRFGIVHIASHGEFDTVNPLFSAIKLAGSEKPDAGETDGDLEAREVFGLAINADMVVLSACQTGLGKVTAGDDVIGLNRAFFYAGTHTVVSSLWRVSDVATAVLAKQFYRKYVTNNKADSLRLAMLHVKNRHPHPGYWGAFTLVGDYE